MHPCICAVCTCVCYCLFLHVPHPRACVGRSRALQAGACVSMRAESSMAVRVLRRGGPSCDDAAEGAGDGAAAQAGQGRRPQRGGGLPAQGVCVRARQEEYWLCRTGLCVPHGSAHTLTEAVTRTACVVRPKCPWKPSHAAHSLPPPLCRLLCRGTGAALREKWLKRRRTRRPRARQASQATTTCWRCVRAELANE